MMSNGMAHEEAREALEALALDALSAPERAAILAHVDGCAACRHELAVLEASVAELAYAVRPVHMSDAQRDRVRGRLVQRAAAERADATHAPPALVLSDRVPPHRRVSRHVRGQPRLNSRPGSPDARHVQH